MRWVGVLAGLQAVREAGEAVSLPSASEVQDAKELVAGDSCI